MGCHCFVQCYLHLQTLSLAVVLPVSTVALQVKKVRREPPVDRYDGRNPFQEHQSKRVEKVCIGTNPRDAHLSLVL